MTGSAKLVLALMSAFAIGVALPALVIWNPADWHWADELVGRRQEQLSEASTESGLWTCAMHPGVIAEEPGECPICGMRLTKVEGVAATSSAEGERRILYWRAPMDPNFVSDQPGKSPMGMDLIPVYEDEAPTSADAVRVDPNFLQNFAVLTAPVEQGSVPIEIRTIGTVSHNEATLVSVNTKFDGWIERAYHNNVGESVKKGAPLFEIYSPQLVTTQQEYLAALDYAEKLSRSAYSEAATRARSLVEAGRERLRYWDVGEEQIARLNETRRITRTVTVRSPSDGFIVSKPADSLNGMRLTSGMTVLKLADHSRLWVEVELYEDDLRHVSMGTSVSAEARSFPGLKWHGRVVLLDTALDPRTRTLKAFAEVRNTDMKLRPGMFVDVVIRKPRVRGAVKVPRQAVLHSGERSIVIVELHRGVFEPREVQLGGTAGGEQEVTEGLREGEVVVTSSQFLIDSESNLRAAISRLLGNRSSPTDPAPEPDVQHRH